jgi:predicted nucleotidyltransferase
MIDLDESSLNLVKSILVKYLPDTEVRAFGSRLSGRAKKFSDLDLLIMSEKPISIDLLNQLKFEFSNSELVIMIDIIDWHAISTSFQKIILNTSENFLPAG